MCEFLSCYLFVIQHFEWLLCIYLVILVILCAVKALLK
ncbi:WW domain-binding protein 1 [Moritella viscosa]|uniref:WW domain-binding protein 1 n=1 Tax=Moritella viscosa TaxID=80854 RepID=A0ABY1HDX2_9GAMM|nr:WW domain-binding protein 1 [Moritella viscosa]SGY97844.1 WW domain-binding protein 1 [Moritella viscosa]SGY98255.1 WW domain-binding protein 1 [Moritella viscosa]SGZ04328.1 WW domain-binding protein 1 [Moritella viscosa]SHO26591.1 WW domain-binding protein 1 [Moritella viscosa]